MVYFSRVDALYTQKSEFLSSRCVAVSAFSAGCVLADREAMSVKCCINYGTVTPFDTYGG